MEHATQTRDHPSLLSPRAPRGKRGARRVAKAAARSQRTNERAAAAVPILEKKRRPSPAVRDWSGCDGGSERKHARIKGGFVAAHTRESDR